MGSRVIQGFFIGGSMRPQAAPRGGAQPRHPTGAPQPAFAGRASPLQARMAPGRPPLAHQGAAPVAQPHGGNGSFAIDPVQLGLARGGGQPLPQAVLAKMEAAFGADFSAVRVHVGPQAARIGAVAFTMGDDLYFAPGQFQPGSSQGQQLLGHELAHVIQQREGRVPAPGSGVTVVQNRLLEAEADRLGMRAATHRVAERRGHQPIRARGAPGRPASRQPVQRQVGGWSHHSVESGVTVYHVTTLDSALAIATNGVQPVQNAFGGGRLGSGFYTHTSPVSAANYFQGDGPVTLEFTTIRKMAGQIAPHDVYVASHKLDYLTGNDFVTAEEDPNELKFHSGDGLNLVAVHQGGQRFGVDEWLGFLE
jgi:hypothetical protein